MQLHFDASACNAHGRCYSLAPELVDVDDEGYPAALGSTLEIPAGDERLADEIAGTCPERAINVVTSP